MDYSIAERRKKLSDIRFRLTNQTPEEPFSVSYKINEKETISSFVVAIAFSIHKRRKTSKTHD